jgi:Ca-activated chloride channel homolog
MLPYELTRPWMLLLLIPSGTVLAVFFVRSLSDFPQRQRAWSLATRCLIVTLLILSLAGLSTQRLTDEQFVVLLADHSLSVGEDGREWIERFLEQAALQRRHHRVAYLPFAAEPGAVQQVPFDEQVLLDRDGTDLAAVIEAAAGSIPPGFVPQLVLLSDGNATAGDALAAAARCRVPVSTVPLPARSEPEVQVAEVLVPAEVREGEPFYVEATIYASHDDQGLIEVFRGDHRVIGERRPLKAGENRFRFQQTIERERLAAFTVRVSQLEQDTLLDNNADSGLVYAAGRPRVLVIESDPNLIRELAYALEDEGIQVDIRPPQGMPDTLADLQNYELLVLSNVPATALRQQQMEVARTYVQQLGGGLIMLGGEQSFGLGGYYKTTLEEILPVRSDFEKEKENPTLAMVLVLDKSGSMSGERIEMAKSAARAAVELLGRRDQIGVIAFDGDTYVISEMQPALNREKIASEIARIEAAGGTTMYPAIEQAFQMLLPVSAPLKHAIVLTDGIAEQADFEGLAQTMAAAKITVSTVAVGDGSDTQLLEQIARVGKGRYYLTEDPAQVPQIFARETTMASKSAIDEQPFVPQVIRATHALADLDIEAAPFLLGYVMTRAKPTSEVILATEKGDPLLAWWRYGLGMAAAFTSDAKSRWAAEWITWPGYGKFWTQVVRQTMRSSDARGMHAEIVRRGPSADMTVDLTDATGRFVNQAEVELTVIGPQLRPEKATLQQTAPGRYTARFDASVPGAYHLELSAGQHGQTLYRQSRGLMVGYSDELRIRPVNESLLQQIAAVSGGRYSPEPAEVFDQPGRWAIRPVPLWPWLLSIAAWLVLLDVALRRIDLSAARKRVGNDTVDHRTE